jgi:hypothetical protein
MPNPNHDQQGKFSSGPGEGANRMTMTQAHAFRVRGNLRVKPGAVPPESPRRTFTSAARERAALNQDLDRRGSSGGGGQAAAEAGGDTRRALSLATKRRRKW